MDSRENIKKCDSDGPKQSFYRFKMALGTNLTIKDYLDIADPKEDENHRQLSVKAENPLSAQKFKGVFEACLDKEETDYLTAADYFRNPVHTSLRQKIVQEEKGPSQAVRTHADCLTETSQDAILFPDPANIQKKGVVAPETENSV